MMLPQRVLYSNEAISKAFKEFGVATFEGACYYVKNLPYGRNKDKESPFVVLNERCGTCSTKHALLKRLADENGLDNVILMTGIYKMDKNNTPGIGAVLSDNNLGFMPEAHNYLKVGEERFDFTFPGANKIGFSEELLEETAILPHQITDYKITLHKNFLSRWLLDNKNINLSLDKLWEIREQCIGNLSVNNNSK